MPERKKYKNIDQAKHYVYVAQKFFTGSGDELRSKSADAESAGSSSGPSPGSESGSCL